MYAVTHNSWNVEVMTLGIERSTWVMGDVPCQKNGSGSKSGGMTDGAIRTIRLIGNEIVLCGPRDRLSPNRRLHIVDGCFATIKRLVELQCRRIYKGLEFPLFSVH